MNASFRCVVALALGVFPGLGRADIGGSGVTLIEVYSLPRAVAPEAPPRKAIDASFSFTPLFSESFEITGAF